MAFVIILWPSLLLGTELHILLAPISEALRSAIIVVFESVLLFFCPFVTHLQTRYLSVESHRWFTLSMEKAAEFSEVNQNEGNVLFFFNEDSQVKK